MLSWYDYARFVEELEGCEWEGERPAEHQAQIDYYEGPRPWRHDLSPMFAIAARNMRYDLIDHEFDNIPDYVWRGVLASLQFQLETTLPTSSAL